MTSLEVPKTDSKGLAPDGTEAEAHLAEMGVLLLTGAVVTAWQVWAEAMATGGGRPDEQRARLQSYSPSHSLSQMNKGCQRNANAVPRCTFALYR
jgi:hypothetical protein